MIVSLVDRPRLIDGLYTTNVDGNTLYYNPMGSGGVTVVDDATVQLIALCNGSNSLEDISKQTVSNAKEVVANVQVLAEREVLYISPDFTREVCRHRPRKSLVCWVHLTNRCNLACVYCYIHKSPGDMSMVTAKTAVDKIINSCRRAGIPSFGLKFAGGEPLLRLNDLKAVVSYAEANKGELKSSYVVLTNSTLVTDEVAEYLAENDFGVGTSLDGLQVAHDRARYTPAGRGSYEAVIKGLNALTAVGISPSVNATISRANYRDIRELTSLMMESGWKFRYSLERDTDTGNPSVLEHESEVIDELMACYDLIEQRLPTRDITKIHQFGDTVFN